MFERNKSYGEIIRDEVSSPDNRSLLQRIKRLFALDQRYPTEQGIGSRSDNQISRLEFLQLFGGAAIFFGLSMAGVPVLADQDNRLRGTLTNVTDREKEGFTYPEDIHGNESFWGNDVLLTIDDCVDLESTRTMFNILRTRGLKATFFPNTDYLPLDNPETVGLYREMYQDGFEIGYHTQDHNVADFTSEQLAQDLRGFEEHIRVLLDDESFSIKFARPPYGNWNNTWMQFIRQERLSNVRWNFVPNVNTNSVGYFEAVTNHPEGGRIILLHSRFWDSNWLENNIDDLKLFAESNGGRVTNLSGNPIENNQLSIRNYIEDIV